MTKQDQDSHDRKQALNMAIATHGEHSNHDTVLKTARAYYAFLVEPPIPISVALPPPSGMPERRAEDLIMPADTIDSVMVEEVATTELQEMRRVKLYELDVLARVLKSRGVVPC